MRLYSPYGLLGDRAKHGLPSEAYTGESGSLVWPTPGSQQNFVLAKTYRCTVGYTRESLVQTSRPANALIGTIPQKSRLGVLSTGYWEEILVLKICLTWLILIDSPM
jgi:hypothetical protein